MKIGIQNIVIWLVLAGSAFGASTVQILIPNDVLLGSAPSYHLVSYTDLEHPLAKAIDLRKNSRSYASSTAPTFALSSSITLVRSPNEGSFTFSPFSGPKSHLVHSFGRMGSFAAGSGVQVTEEDQTRAILGAHALRCLRISKLASQFYIGCSQDLARRQFAQDSERNFESEAIRAILKLDE